MYLTDYYEGLSDMQKYELPMELARTGAAEVVPFVKRTPFILSVQSRPILKPSKLHFLGTISLGASARISASFAACSGLLARLVHS